MLRKPTLYNKLAWPAGIVPGFDPNHLAATGCQFTAVAGSGGNAIHLQNARKGTLSSTVTTGFNAAGPYLTGANGTNANVSWTTGQVASAQTSITIAAIVSFTSVSAQQILINTAANSSSGWFFDINGVGAPRLSANLSNTATSGITLAINTPYFVVASSTGVGAGSTVYFLAANLLTGQIFKSTITASLTVTTATAGVVWGKAAASVWANTQQAAGMFSVAALSPQQLAQWAADPWAFWYPRNIDLTQIMSPAIAAGGSFLAAWASQSNLPVLGTGTY